jgi:hypothetical protein
MSLRVFVFAFLLSAVFGQYFTGNYLWFHNFGPNGYMALLEPAVLLIITSPMRCLQQWLSTTPIHMCYRMEGWDLVGGRAMFSYFLKYH